MLNIITLQGLRKKSTGPSKVAKNLMKGLDLIGEPYIINGDPKVFKNILILDDDNIFRQIHWFPVDAEIMVGPNIESRNKALNNKYRNAYRFIYPSNRIKKIGDNYGYHNYSIVWPVGIDTYIYNINKNMSKNQVLIYFKTRFSSELNYCKNLLERRNMKYSIINYDTGYKESDFLDNLDTSKYVIWIGRQETQGIALQETLSKNIPILLWDVRKMGDWEPTTDFEKNYYANNPEQKEPATSAEYFDETCGIRFYDKEDLEKNIEKMESNWNSAYAPRKYIENNLSLEKQAKEMISFYSDPSRGNNIKKKKYLRNNLLLKLGWIIIDSKLFSIFYKPLVSLYQKISIKK